MERVIAVLFVSINDFEVEFYKTMENSLRMSTIAYLHYFKTLSEEELLKIAGLESSNDNMKTIVRTLNSKQKDAFKKKIEQIEREKEQKAK